MDIKINGSTLAVVGALGAFAALAVAQQAPPVNNQNYPAQTLPAQPAIQGTDIAANANGVFVLAGDRVIKLNSQNLAVEGSVVLTAGPQRQNGNRTNNGGNAAPPNGQPR